LNAQIIKQKNRNLITESDIYIDKVTGCRYSKLITFKLNDNYIELENGVKNLRTADIQNKNVKNLLTCIEKNYGNFYLSKLVPSAEWGDTLIRNKRTGKLVSIPDWSQVFQMRFIKLVPIDSVIQKLINSGLVIYAEGPFQSYITISPNDEKYLSGNNWAFEKIEAERAWNITRGDTTIIIGIHDYFSDTLVTALHEDLIGKAVSYTHLTLPTTPYV
jgi:hypothetical protein